MRARNKTGGFSIIELMLGVIAMAVLVLAIGSMLVFGWRGWRHGNEIVNMQRDASLALRVIAKEIRMSNFSAITDGNPLICPTASGTATFTWSGGNLDISGSSPMRLVQGWTTYFNSEKMEDASGGVTSQWVRIALNLNTGVDQINNTLDVYPRN